MFRRSVLVARKSRSLNQPKMQMPSARSPVAAHLEEEADLIDEATMPVKGLRSRAHARREMNLANAQVIADRVKSMSDAEWESVPQAEKHAFTGFIGKQLRERPSSVSEQQRRRYYETTMADPLAEDPARTVTDTAERMRLGLPTPILADRRSLGVSNTIYEQADASLFDPKDAVKIENAMTEVKQMFVDYVDKKKAGVSTETERRALAKASEELNFQTQTHLASMFKHAEAKLQDVILEERRKQLRRIAVVRAAMQRQAKTGKGAPKKSKRNKTSTKATDNSTNLVRDGSTASSAPHEKPFRQLKRSENVKRVLRDAYGLDVDTANAVWQQVQAQERFLRLCEVMTRLTTARGFSHTAADESLDEYTSKMRDVYSSDPKRLSRLDAVQYVAATEGVAPVDWATRWYEKLLLLPLQATPEFAEVRRIQEEEDAVARGAGILPPSAAPAGTDSTLETSDSSRTTFSSTTSDLASEPCGAAAAAMKSATNLVHKMFLPTDDPRIDSMHEKRLRYIAHVHMESQVRRMRKNARMFEGAENTEEAARCRHLYESISKRKEELAKRAHEGDPKAVEIAANPYSADADIRIWFEEIQAICKAFIEARTKNTNDDKKRERAAQIAESLGAGRPEALTAELRRLRRERKKEQVERLLRLLERDVREDMLWVKNMQEADRPAPLPVPEPMSYVGAADVLHWRDLREKDSDASTNPFTKAGRTPSGFKASLFGQPWHIPEKPMLFWGTGTGAVEQALRHAAEDAARRRGSGSALPPPYPCAENPWGWRLRRDILDDDEGADQE
jgi:hypothetical protein